MSVLAATALHSLCSSSSEAETETIENLYANESEERKEEGTQANVPQAEGDDEEEEYATSS